MDLKGKESPFSVQSTKMKTVLCLVFALTYVAAELCNHDSDCTLTSCGAGYRLDCHEVHGVRQCTCMVTDSDHCFDDHWCALNMQHRCHEEGKRWHCSPRDQSCRCYCDGTSGRSIHPCKLGK